MVLAVLGPSGVGKSRAAQSIALARGMTWIQVDDLRLALQASDLERPSATMERLHDFERATNIWSRSPQELKEAMIEIARLMAPAVRIVIDSHIVTGVPAVIEGDGILPTLATDPVLRSHVVADRLRFCCVVPETLDELLVNVWVRGRGIAELNAGERVRRAEMNVAFGRWLAEESARCEIPVVCSRPLTTLPQRIGAAGAS